MIKKDRKKKSKLPRYGRDLERARIILWGISLVLLVFVAAISVKDNIVGENEKASERLDTEPPHIEVSGLIICQLGGRVEYRPYVTLSDNSGSEVELIIDESGLELDRVGDYTVYISAIDRAGNKSEPIPLTVRVVDGYAPELLEPMLARLVGDISPNGKSKEQICRDIYDAVRESLIYTGSSEKGDLHRAAYYALVGGGGDCYSYFSLTCLLLDRCGIENMGIERLSGACEGAHFWNYVNIGTSESPRWYHLDTTPINAGEYSFSGCLLTDRQIEAYSKIRRDFYLYDKSEYPSTEGEIITPTPALEDFY